MLPSATELPGEGWIVVMSTFPGRASWACLTLVMPPCRFPFLSIPHKISLKCSSTVQQNKRFGTPPLR